ncbi:type II toxin-antitoxin system RelE/ParE family toxin [Starkeya koreensis]|uniref:Type II toxin-antitoxin system RelE/ParE family toxin n=1 Tax=Ancylobacter koreensis TaxID=266121 RepID=A0ABT0DNV8_9HYPH|nr:type II toxin-antitoxin system RelE/ParE family toxin [Ancylobacter koreensis]
MRYEVRFTAAALDDLAGIYDFIAARSGPLTALAYVERVRAYCRSFSDFPARHPP